MPQQRLQRFSSPADRENQWSPQTALQDCLHEPHQAHRDRIIDTLTNTFYPHLQRSARRLASCSSTARLYVDPDSGSVHPWLNRCKHKLCPFCARARSAQVADQLTTLLRSMQHPRLMILTVKSTTRPLNDQLLSLRRSFARLRRQPAWRDRVAGGAYTLEVTINKRTGLWHPHLHIVYDGEYFPFKLLQRLWHDVTGHSNIVWVSNIKDLPGVARELAKYIGKVQHIDNLTDRQIVQYAQAVNRSRMVQTFGSLHGSKPHDTDHQNEPRPNQYTVSLPRLAWLARQGHDTPLRILPLIAVKWPVFASFIFHQQPQLEPEESVLLRKARALARIRGHAPPKPPGEPKSKVAAMNDGALLALFTRFRLEDQQGDYQYTENWKPDT